MKVGKRERRIPLHIHGRSLDMLKNVKLCVIPTFLIENQIIRQNKRRNPTSLMVPLPRMNRQRGTILNYSCSKSSYRWRSSRWFPSSFPNISLLLFCRISNALVCYWYHCHSMNSSLLFIYVITLLCLIFSYGPSLIAEFDAEYKHPLPTMTEIQAS
jgi:hypothetical protein